MSTLLVLGRGAPTNALKHKFWAFAKGWVEVVVRAALADSVFASPSSMPVLLLGELGCKHNSQSRRQSDPSRDHSKSIREPPFPELGRGG